jgi:signal transduction histidine kinase
VIHDLRQPLASIDLNVSALGAMTPAAPVLERVATSREAVALADHERRLFAELAADLPVLVEELRGSIRFMDDVLEHLAQLRERSIASSERASSELAPLVRLAVSMCRQEAVEHRCTVVNEVPDSLPRVRATSAHVLQILVNLVRNAQQAVGLVDGGGRVVIHAGFDDEAVHVAVRDDGPGMSFEVLSKLGTAFFTTRAEGTGLGVAQVRRLLGALRGRFAVESAPGAGTTVTFSLPRASD